MKFSALKKKNALVINIQVLIPASIPHHRDIKSMHLWIRWSLSVWFYKFHLSCWFEFQKSNSFHEFGFVIVAEFPMISELALLFLPHWTTYLCVAVLSALRWNNNLKILIMLCILQYHMLSQLLILHVKKKIKYARSFYWFEDIF